MTDKVRRSATTVNAAGHILSVYRGPGESVWALFSLSKSSVDTLSARRAPIYRVDKNEPQDLDDERKLTDARLGLTLYSWEPRWVNFQLWHGKEVEGRSEAFTQIVAGKSVVFRYTLFTGGFKETTFSLVGAGPAIAEALGISLNVNPAIEAAVTAYRSEMLQASKRCQQDMSTFRACFERVKACDQKAHRDLGVLQECLR